MPKKGNVDFDDDDFGFDDEMFPLDDSVYDDDDDLAGFSFNPNEESGGGIGGFFKNAMKSVRGFGAEFINEFVPDAVSLVDDVKYGLSDSVDAFIDFKEKSLSKAAGMMPKTEAGSLSKTIKDSFKTSLSNVKKGKFYIAESDKEFDMDAMMNDDDYDDGDGEEEERDTSGVMTSKFNYKKKKRPGSKLVVTNDNSGLAMAMGEMQESATMATSIVNTKLANRQIRNSNENFHAIINVLHNIDSNIYGLSDFLTHYGKTNISTQLEYDSKSLAFLTDQRALLKELIVSVNKSAGIHERDEEEYGEDNKLFRNGFFNFDKYVKHIGKNAKDAFSNTELGGVVEMLGGTLSMMGGEGGIGNMKPGDIIGSLIKSQVMNQFVDSDTKSKFEKLNDVYGNLGGTILSKANSLKDSNSPILSFLGNLLGSDAGINKYLDMNTVDLSEQSAFDVKTKESINEVIPGYLSQITAALTGNDATYYDYEAKRFRTNKSLVERYEYAQSMAIDSNLNFAEGMGSISGGIGDLNKDKNFMKRFGYSELKESTIQKAMDKFKNNVIETKTAINVYDLLNNPEYSKKLFKGFDSIDRENAPQLKRLITTQISSMSEKSLYDLNNSINRVSSDLEDASIDFKKKALLTGGGTILSQINDDERWRNTDYEMEYSSRYNEKLAKTAVAQQNARINRAAMEKDMYDLRGGNVDLIGSASNRIGSGGGLSTTVHGTMNNIFELLTDGIKVYNVSDPEAFNTRMRELGDSSAMIKKDRADREAEIAAKEQGFIDMKSQSSKNAIQFAREKAARDHSYKIKSGKSGGILGNWIAASGMQDLGKNVFNLASKPMRALMGDSAFDDTMSSENIDSETLKLAQKEVEKSRKEKAATLEKLKKFQEEAEKDKSVNEDGSEKKFKFVDSLMEGGSKLLTKAAIKREIMAAEAALAADEKQAKDIEEVVRKADQVEKEGSTGYLTSGKDIYIKGKNSLLSNRKKGIVYISDSWWNKEEKNSLKAWKWINEIYKNNYSITTTLDENVDIAIVGQESKEDYQILNKFKIQRFDIKDGHKDFRSFAKSENTIHYLTKMAENRRKFSDGQLESTAVLNRFRDKGVDAKISLEEKSVKSARGVVEKSKQPKYDHLKSMGESEHNMTKGTARFVQHINQNIGKTRKSVKDKNISIYPTLSSIKSSGEAGSVFLNKNAQIEIDQLLASGNEDAIIEFAKKIESGNEESSNKNSLNHLDKKFRTRVEAFLNEDAFKGGNVAVKSSFRTPLRQFALYSKGRVSKEITDKLLKMSGLKSGVGYFKGLKDSETVAQSIASNHLTGRAIDVSNGNVGYNKLGAISAKYGLRWGGAKDKPHFEFDDNFKGKLGEGVYASAKKPMDGGGSMSAAAEAAQSDPADTIVTGEYTERKSTISNKSLRTIHETLLRIEEATTRTASNTESIGFGIGIPGFKGKGLFGKIGSSAKDLIGKAFGFAGGVINSMFSKGKDLLSSGGQMLMNFGSNVKDRLTGGFGKIKDRFTNEDIKKMSVEDLYKNFKLQSKLKLSLEEVQNIYTPEELQELCLHLRKDGSLLSKGKSLLSGAGGRIGELLERAKGMAGKGWNKGKKLFGMGKELLGKGFAGAKDLAGKGWTQAKIFGKSALDNMTGLAGTLVNKGREFLDNRKPDLEKLKVMLAEKLGVAKETLANLSPSELIAKAKEMNIKIPNLSSMASSAFEGVKGIGKGIMNTAGGILSGIGGGLGFGGGKFKTLMGALAAINTNIIAVGSGSGNFVQIPEYSKGGGGGGSGDSFFGRVGKGLGQIGSAGMGIAKTGFGTAKGLAKSGIGMIGNMGRSGLNFVKGLPGRFKRGKDVEGSYADQKDDKLQAEKEERERSDSSNLASIALALGAPASADALANPGVEPESNMLSLLKASYMNSEEQNQLLSKMDNGGGGMKMPFGAAGLKAGLMAAGGVATIGAAGAGAYMLGKQVSNKVKDFKTNWGNSSTGEKISSVLGGGGTSNYDTSGNEITDKDVKAGQGFGLGQAGHVLQAAKAISKIMPMFEKLVAKLLSNPKVVARLGQGSVGVLKTGFIAMFKKAVGKGVAGLATKIAAFCAKATNPIGWGVFIAQFLLDYANGYNDAKRYFKMGKGLKPTVKMKESSAIANAISGSLTFGLVPPEYIANWFFKISGDKSMQEQMLSAAEFDKKRAKIMGVEYKRLVEFETMPWTEIIFGGDKKRATILGFMEGKDDKDGKGNFKNWFDKVYSPLDNMYKSMTKQFGGKVTKKIDPKDTEGMEKVAEFRSAYLKAAEDFVKSNNLTELGAIHLGKKKSDATATVSTEGSMSKEDTKSIEAMNSGGSVEAKDATAESAQADAPNPKQGVMGAIKGFAASIFGKKKEGSSGGGSGSGTGSSGGGGNFLTKAKDVTSSTFNNVKNAATNFVGSAGQGILKGVKGAAAAIASFVSRRKESESAISSLFGSPDGQNELLKLQDNIVDKSRLGQQTSASTLNPIFGQRVEAFLKDPRIQNKGVSIREGYRSPATQLAYFSKGRAPDSITDKLMKKAGFSAGSSFWPSSFRKPGDYITWTLASNHFNGTAIDLNPGKVGYDTLGKIAGEYGIDWGGNWKNKDMPHFEMSDAPYEGPGAFQAAGVADSYQADTFNYGSSLKGVKQSKVNYSNSTKSIASASRTASYTKNLTNQIRGSSSKSSAISHNNQATGMVTSNLVVSKVDELLKLSTEGVDIMRDLLNEQKRHNKINEEALITIVKSIGAIGGLIAATSNGGQSSASSSNSITNGAFDQIAKGF
ncbi:MAG: M15 family metallopeptidase [Anaeroplasmataceae bacterium]